MAFSTANHQNPSANTPPFSLTATSNPMGSLKLTLALFGTQVHSCIPPADAIKLCTPVYTGNPPVMEASVRTFYRTWYQGLRSDCLLFALITQPFAQLVLI